MIKSRKTRVFSVLLAMAMIFAFFPQTGKGESYAEDKKEILVTDIYSVSKVYDGNREVVIDDISYKGKDPGHEVEIQGIGEFDTKDVGTNKTVSIKDWELLGDDAYKYTVKSGIENTTGTIKKKRLTLRLKDLGKLTYNGKEQMPEIIKIGLVDGDKCDITLSEFSDPNTNKPQKNANVDQWGDKSEPVYSIVITDENLSNKNYTIGEGASSLTLLFQIKRTPITIKADDIVCDYRDRPDPTWRFLSPEAWFEPGYPDVELKAENSKGEAVDVTNPISAPSGYEYTIIPYLDPEKAPNYMVSTVYGKYNIGAPALNFFREDDTYLQGGQETSIWFGTYEQNLQEDGEEPVKWRILDNEKDDKGGSIGRIFMLSDQVLDWDKFEKGSEKTTWGFSTIRSWLNGYGPTANRAGEDYQTDNFKDRTFTKVEQKLLQGIPTEWMSPTYQISDRVVMLSKYDTENEDYGFKNTGSSDGGRKATPTEYAISRGAFIDKQQGNTTHWWLRDSSENRQTYVSSVGLIEYDADVLNNHKGIRPAITLGVTRDVLFSSAAIGGKRKDVGENSLQPVGINQKNEWKLTLKEEEHDKFTVDKVSTCDGKILNIKYSKAQTGDNEYISAAVGILNMGRVDSYGKLAELKRDGDKSGKVSVDIDGGIEDGTDLYIFNEQENGDKMTDYSSDLRKIEIPSTLHDLEGVPALGPTCDRPGYEPYWKCNDCHKMFSDKDGKIEIKERIEIAPTGHDFTQKRAESRYLKSDADCEHPAEYYVSCGNCNESSKGTEDEATFESGDSLGHNYEKVDGTAKDPTCIEDGKETDMKCSRCGDTQGGKTIPKTGHAFDQEKAEEKYLKTAAGCLHPAEYYVSCSKCDASSKGEGDKEATFESGEPLGHDFSVELPETAKAPTCTENGQEADMKCYRCEEKQEGKKIDKTGHLWGEWKVTKKPTALNKGKEKRVCKHDPSHIETNVIAATGVSGTAVSKMKAKGKNALTIGWSKIRCAEGYDIFFAKCGKTSKYKKVKTINGNKTFSWTKTGLKTKKPYKAYVKAWAMKGGKKKYVNKAPSVHTYTSGSTRNYTVAKAVKVNKTKVSLKKGKTFRIKASIIRQNKKKKLMPTDHAPKLRYVTSDSKIATVTKSGKIKAKAKGSCKIYVLAHNGVSKQIKVVVNSSH